LAQVWKLIGNSLTIVPWLNSIEIGLLGALSTKWDSYHKYLIDLGAYIQDQEDTLIWTGGDKTRMPSVKNFYMEILSTKQLSIQSSWRRTLWRWNTQLKIKLFICLVVAGKILTWDTLQAKGRHGPGLCYLCKKKIESIDHILIHCSFTKMVWEKVRLTTCFKVLWDGFSLVDFFKTWVEDRSVPSALAAQICWFIWIERNKAIFEGRIPSVLAVYYKDLAFPRGKETKLKDKLPRSIVFPMHINSSIAYFDGATHLDGLCCGVDGILKLPDSTFIGWTFHCVHGTNNKVELLGAWATLRLELHLSIKHLQMLGDSKVVINWLKKKGSLHACAIEGWKARIRAMV